MAEDKQFKIDIPQSLDSYKVTQFWGLTVKQIVMVFIAVIFAGFGIFSLPARHFMAAILMLAISGLALLGIVEIHGRNFYRYLLFIFFYYKTKPQVLVYSHNSSSGIAGKPIYQKDENRKTFVLILSSIAIGLLLLILTVMRLYHVIHK